MSIPLSVNTYDSHNLYTSVILKTLRIWTTGWYNFMDGGRRGPVFWQQMDFYNELLLEPHPNPS
jgi:hypothetical protein